MLVRRLARPMLASTFIFGGIDALRHPETKAPKAEKLDIPSKPYMDKLNITTTEQAVRVNAAVQVAGGTLLTFNKFPRLSALALAASLVPTTAAGHRFWEETDRREKALQQTQFFKNMSMFGGLLIATVDTEGKESLARKTKRVSKRSQRKAAQSAAQSSAKATAKSTAKSARKAAFKSAAKAGKKAGKTQRVASDKLHELLPI